MASEPALAVRALVEDDHGGVRLRVDLSFERGLTLVRGPSGAGKSTLLSVIAGLVRPSAGRVVLDGAVLFDSERAVELPTHRRRVALVFQSLALFPHLTAAENVAYGLPRGASRQLALDWLARARVAHVAERKPPQLSGGEAQRVALARALASSPRALLLDEPFSALDDALRSELLRELRGWVEELAVPALLVTHDVDCDDEGRSVWIERGEAGPTGR